MENEQPGENIEEKMYILVNCKNKMSMKQNMIVNSDKMVTLNKI